MIKYLISFLIIFDSLSIGPCKDTIKYFDGGLEERYSYFLDNIYNNGLISPQKLEAHIIDLQNGIFNNIFENTEKSTFIFFAKIINDKYKGNVSAKKIFKNLPNSIFETISIKKKKLNESKSIASISNFIKVAPLERPFKIYDKYTELSIEIDKDFYIMPLLISNFQWNLVMNEDVTLNLNSAKINTNYFELSGYYEVKNNDKTYTRSLSKQVFFVNYELPRVTKRGYKFLSDEDKSKLIYKEGFIDKVNILAKKNNPIIYKIFPDHQQGDTYRLPYQTEWRAAVLSQENIDSEDMINNIDPYKIILHGNKYNNKVYYHNQIEDISLENLVLKDNTYSSMAGTSLGLGEFLNETIKTTLQKLKSKKSTKQSEYIRYINSGNNNNHIKERILMIGTSQGSNDIFRFGIDSIRVVEIDQRTGYSISSPFRLVRERPE